MNNISYALSNHDIENWFLDRFLPKPTVCKYEDFPKNGIINYPAFILYEWEPGFGHWTVLFERNDGILEFFDSFGETADHHISDTFYNDSIKASRLIVNYLIKTSRRHNKSTVEVNDIQYQSPDSFTCGKWCIMKYYLTAVYPLGDSETQSNLEFEDIFKTDSYEKNDYRINKVFSMF